MEGFGFLKPADKLAELDRKARKRESKDASFETFDRANLPSKHQKAKVLEAFELMKPQDGSALISTVRLFVTVLLGVKEPQETRTSAQTLNPDKALKEAKRALSQKADA